ncbi:MAG TPA: hypothetical protein VFN10_16565 [Thermoanaerobaculia bacterium]|nr:hypothetical protein [Thermoanaerobaculia bacterium]
MKKTLSLFAFAVLLTANAFATYMVVLKDGTRYKAKAKWTVVNGKALVNLESGQSLQLDPALIDGPRSEQLTKMGITDGNILDLNPNLPAAQEPKPTTPSLGSSVRLRPLGGNEPAPTRKAPPTAPAPSASTPAVVPIAGAVPAEVVDRFAKAFDNVGIYDVKITSTGGASLRAEGTADNEDRVFLAISAASFLLVRNGGVAGVNLDMVELFLKTTNGGAAGRFQMTRADAEALDKVPPAARQNALQDYFVHKVIY